MCRCWGIWVLRYSFWFRVSVLPIPYARIVLVPTTRIVLSDSCQHVWSMVYSNLYVRMFLECHKVMISSFAICSAYPDADANYFLKYGRWILKRLPVFILGLTIAQKPLNLKTNTYCLLGAVFMFANLISLHYIIAVNADPEIASFPAKFFVQFPDRTVIPDNGRYLLDMLSVFFLCPLFAGIGRICRRIKVEFIITWLGASSLELYLCHQYIYKAVEMNLQKSNLMEFVLALCITLCMACVIRYCTSKLSIAFQNYFICQ